MKKKCEEKGFKKIRLFRHGRINEVTTYPTLEEKWSCKFIDDPEFPEYATIIFKNVTFSKKEFNKKEIPRVLILEYKLQEVEE